MKRAAIRSHCPINFALESLGDKWSLLVIRDMVFYDKHTYGEFLQSEERIATNVLAARLALLVREGIAYKVPHPTDNRKELFYLTNKGLDLIPVLLQIEAWSATYDPKTDISPAFAKRIEADFRKLCEDVREGALHKQANQPSALAL